LVVRNEKNTASLNPRLAVFNGCTAGNFVLFLKESEWGITIEGIICYNWLMG
jgi:hypothetical protein